MKCILFVLLMALGATAQGQSASDSAGQPGARRPAAEKQQLAIGMRVSERVNSLDARKAAQYAENRERCQVALRIAEQCGRFAGAFYCDEKGFKAIPERERIKVVARHKLSPVEQQSCGMTATAAP